MTSVWGGMQSLVGRIHTATAKWTDQDLEMGHSISWNVSSLKHPGSPCGNFPWGCHCKQSRMPYDLCEHIQVTEDTPPHLPRDVFIQVLDGLTL